MRYYLDQELLPIMKDSTLGELESYFVNRHFSEGEKRREINSKSLSSSGLGGGGQQVHISVN